MPTINETEKFNSKVAQLKLLLDKDFMKHKYNLQFIFDKINDSNHQIVATDYLELHHKQWIGCTALHFAVADSNLEAFDILTRQGADFTIKNSSGSTAFHQIVEQNSYLISGAYSSDDTFVHSFLSAHITYSKYENPVNSNGLSHFHIACAVDNVEVVNRFLQNGVFVDHTVNADSPLFPGFSPLHFAAKNCAVGVAEVLLLRGANIQKKDVKGMTPLHLVLERKLEIISEIDSINTVKDSTEKILRLFLEKESNDDMMIIDDWGISHFHVACALKYSSAAECLLQKVVNINHAVNTDSPLWPGYTPLHFAAQSNIDTVKSLMKKGADMSLKDAKGVTPFDICIERCKTEDIYAILSLHSIWKNTLLSDGKTKLTDLVFAMRNSSQFEMFLKEFCNNVIICDSPLWLGYSPMHLAVMLSKEIAEDSEKTSIEILRILCQQNPDMFSSQDIHGYTPLHLAFRLNKKSALDLLLNFLETYPNLIDQIDEDGLSFVHIASAQNNVSLLERMFAIGADVNAVYKGKPLPSAVMYSGSTPLHSAVIHGSINATVLLMKQGADMYARDTNDMTPVHMLLLNDDARILLTSTNLRDAVVSGMGLSHLHVASRFSISDAVERLLDDGANINAVITYQPKAMKLPFVEKYDGYSPALMAYESDSFGTLLLLLKHGADVYVKDANGKALLHSILESNTSFYFNMFMDVLMKRVDLQTRLKADTGMTDLHVACLNCNSAEVEKLLNEGANVNAQIRSDSPIMKGYTPLHVAMHVIKEYADDDVDQVIKLLMQADADVTLQNGKLGTVVHMAWKLFNELSRYAENFEIDKSQCKRVNMLLEAQRDLSLNPVDVGGISHFHIACNLCNVGVVQKFLSRGDVDVDQPIDYFHPTETGYTALHLAAVSPMEFCGITKQLCTIDLLLNHGANVRAEDDYGDTPLHGCARINSLDLFERLFREWNGVNARNIYGDTPLGCFLESKNVSAEGIKILLRFGYHLNTFTTATGEGYMGLTVDKLPDSDLENFVSAVTTNFKQQIEVDNLGRTIIHNVVSISPPKISATQYAALIEQLSVIGCDVDSQDYLGRTALHMAAQFHNYKGISGLLMIGADVNIIDVHGKTPFAYDFETCIQCHTNCENSSESDDDEDEGKETCKHLETLETVACHVKKLQLCALEVSKQTEDLACRAFKKFKNKTTWSDNFLKELELVKNITIESHTVTLSDFLSENGAVADYPTMSQMKREDIKEFFSPGKVQSLREKFPEVAGVLQLQYRKARARPQLIESGKNALSSLIGFWLPEICSHFILILLSNSELKNLIASTNE